LLARAVDLGHGARSSRRTVRASSRQSDERPHSLRADLLVMGTHGRSGLRKTLIGSVTEQALRTFSVDILAVPRSAPLASI
jgi:nucleotide-binding universal stress UspA family protein